MPALHDSAAVTESLQPACTRGYRYRLYVWVLIQPVIIRRNIRLYNLSVVSCDCVILPSALGISLHASVVLTCGKIVRCLRFVHFYRLILRKAGIVAYIAIYQQRAEKVIVDLDYLKKGHLYYNHPSIYHVF